MFVVFHSLKMFSLKKLAYCACNIDEKLYHDERETERVEVKDCCINVLQFLKDKGEYTSNAIPNGKYKCI